MNRIKEFFYQLVCCVIYTGTNGMKLNLYSTTRVFRMDDLFSFILSTDKIYAATFKYCGSDKYGCIEYYRNSSEKGFTVSVDGVLIFSFSDDDVRYYLKRYK